MFGLFSLSTVALVVLYAWGFFMMTKVGVNAGKSLLSAATQAAVWPLTAWSMLNALWQTPPPQK